MSKKLKAGDVVEVRTSAEILETLDENACVEGLPFMPEMIPFIGRQFTVSKRAHKTCDTVHQTGGRKLRDCVHLEDLRCDGSGHDGCKATCFLFWKTEWLELVSDGREQGSDLTNKNDDSLAALNSLACAATQESKKSAEDETVYRCQATALYDASNKLRWYDLRQYAEDWSSGNTNISQMLRVWFFQGLQKLMGVGLGYGVWERLYNKLQRRVGGYNNPFRAGTVSDGVETPAITLNLEPGERVRVRSHEEILATLDRDNKNRGMRFDPEMVPYCGKAFTVQRRVDKIIHETTGSMIGIKTASVILDGVVCRSEMSQCRLFCPRAIPSYWREIWLERIDSDQTSSPRG